MHRSSTHAYLDTSGRRRLRRSLLILTIFLSACAPRGGAQGLATGDQSGAAGKPLVWIGATGDVMPGRGTAEILSAADGPKAVFGGLLPLMQAEDLLIANLETSVTERGTPWPKTYRFRISPALLGPLKIAGIDLVTLTNNHVYDYGDEGFLDTLTNLRAAGLPYAGAGLDFAEAATPWSGIVGGEAIRVWALGAYPVERTGFSGPLHAAVQRGKPGILWADDRALAELSRQFADIDAQATAAGDGKKIFKVVCLHAGTEYSSTATPAQEELCRSLIDRGADLVIGHHPHVLEPVEWHCASAAASGGKPGHGGLIVYSLGNYLFDGMDGIPFANEGMLLSVGIRDGEIRALRMDGAKLLGPVIDLDTSLSIAKRLREMSPSIGRFFPTP